MPCFSVIIPTYNRREFVVKAIDSVLNQTCTDYEIIVVDDGSSDGTCTALQPYGDRISYLRQDNSGVSAARNAGILQARGEWIAFLDSDDEWSEDYLATQLTHIGRYPDAVAHLTNAENLFPDGRINNHFIGIGFMPRFGTRTTLLLDRPFRHIVGHTHWFLQSTVVKREVVMEAGLFDRSLTIAEDMDLLGRIALKGPFSLCSAVKVHIFRREEQLENLAQQFVRKGIASRQAFIRVFRQLLAQPGLDVAEKLATANVLGSTWRALGNVLLLASRTSEARRAFGESLRVFPSARSAIKFLATFLPHRISALAVRRGREIEPGESGGDI